MESVHTPDIAWRLNAERLVLLGWSRAILLQFAHPLIAAGVHDHSGFRASPVAAIRRLRHTVQAMLSLTFGDPATQEQALAGIRAIHTRVNGHLPDDVGPFPAGTPYSAEDPELLLWVHLTLIESVVLVYEELVQPLTEHERDAYCQSAAPIAVALGARQDEVPRTWHDLRAALDAGYRSGRIVVGPQAKRLSQALLHPRGLETAAGPLAWMNEVLTMGLLPEGVRSQYGVGWNARRERALRRIVRVIRALRRVTPSVVAQWRDARRGVPVRRLRAPAT